MDVAKLLLLLFSKILIACMIVGEVESLRHHMKARHSLLYFLSQKRQQRRDKLCTN
jgi:hypothetical protein